MADLGGGGGGGGGHPGLPPPPPFASSSLYFSSLLTCCRYVVTPGLASSARNIVRCLKLNCLGTRPRSIPLRPWPRIVNTLVIARVPYLCTSAILLLGPYTSVYYDVMVGCWFTGQGKKRDCVGKKVNCGPVVGV